MDGLRISVALAPLALYLALVAWLNLRRRPTLVSGPRDLAALGFGVIGMVLVGPIELLQPISAVNQLGPYIWVLSVSLYTLVLSLVLLLSRPRLTIYNITPDALRPLLAQVIEQLDPHHRWAGSSLSMPTLGVQLHLECHRLMRNVSLVANGDAQSQSGWRQLELALAQQLVPAHSRANPWGVGLAVAAVSMAIVTCWLAPLNHRVILAALRDMLPF